MTNHPPPQYKKVVDNINCISLFPLQKDKKNFKQWETIPERQHNYCSKVGGQSHFFWALVGILFLQED